MNGSPFNDRPIIVFWETTRACKLYCIHCRASAIDKPLPGELTTEEGKELIKSILEFGKPYPIVIFTGGDPLYRNDIYELLSYARSLGLRFAISPAVSELLNEEVLLRLKECGVSSVSFSLDGSNSETHDSIRMRIGNFNETINAIKNAIKIGLNVQVNTAVMKKNLLELPKIFHLLKELGVNVWVVFFVIRVGRGIMVQDLSAEECESVCNFLYDASHYGLKIRTREAPFIRRVMMQRKEGKYWNDPLYEKLSQELKSLEGEPISNTTLPQVGTLDGDGIIFVSYDGTIYPGGFLPVPIGNIKNDNIVDVYRKNELLLQIRNRKLNGICGICKYKYICGGSRARSFSFSGDPLGSDPACIFVKETASLQQ